MRTKTINESADFIVVPKQLAMNFKLSGNELLVTSLIYGFTKNGNGEFFGTCEYIATWLNMTRESVVRLLHRLVAKGVLTSYRDVRNGRNVVIYSVNEYYNADYAKYLKVTKGAKSKRQKMSKTATKNHRDNIEDNIDDNIEWAQQKDFAADTREKGEDFEREYEEAEVVETSLFPVKAEKEKSCAKKEKERGKSEVKSEVKSGKVTLFCNSSVYRLVKDDDYSAFEALFKGPEYEDIDLVYYFHAVCDWSSSANKKRTERGWIATVRNFIRGDMERGKLHKKPEKQLICGFTEDEVRDMLKGNKFKI